MDIMIAFFLKGNTNIDNIFSKHVATINMHRPRASSAHISNLIINSSKQAHLLFPTLPPLISHTSFSTIPDSTQFISGPPLIEISLKLPAFTLLHLSIAANFVLYVSFHLADPWID
ncbi:hypothetical protein QVD17_35630 [Tagetes erecta]|uniref:Uncharacterized protein n=1 Tax=Tagetes erecta TaxID=13708 RepID=A0AAD8JWY9_TARER|nr:hypothetical protein QVD17_35630 [Tagetes erecta]